MATSISHVPDLAGNGTSRSSRRRRSPAFSPLTRRSFLKGLVTFGTGVGLASVGLFPSARPSYATHPGGDGYQIDSQCYREDSPESEWGCSVSCGPSPICGDCCIYSGSHGNYHKNIEQGPAQYKLRKNECEGSSSSSSPGFAWDGWEWEETCAGCSDKKRFRCHDGYKWISGAWSNTICQWGRCV